MLGWAHATERRASCSSSRIRSRLGSFRLPTRIASSSICPRLVGACRARPLPQGVGLLERFRYGLFKPGVTRVVLETTGPAAINDMFFLGGSGSTRDHRLVVDLVSTTRAGFLSAVESPAIAVAKTRAVLPTAGRAPSLSVRFIPAPRKPEFQPRKPLIVLDPGHGGVDPGAVGAGGTHEKYIVLSAAREFRSLLEKPDAIASN